MTRCPSPLALLVPFFLLCLTGCGAEYERGYEFGYKDGYREAEQEIFEKVSEDWYEQGYADGEYDFSDPRYIEGYELGYSDGAAGNAYNVSPQRDHVWVSLTSPAVYHEYTLPLPPCATIQTTDGSSEDMEDLSYWEDVIPCDICFPDE